MVPDRQKVWTDGQPKTISLRLRQGIMSPDQTTSYDTVWSGFIVIAVFWNESAYMKHTYKAGDIFRINVKSQ